MKDGICDQQEPKRHHRSIKVDLLFSLIIGDRFQIEEYILYREAVALYICDMERYVHKRMPMVTYHASHQKYFYQYYYYHFFIIIYIEQFFFLSHYTTFILCWLYMLGIHVIYYIFLVYTINIIHFSLYVLYSSKQQLHILILNPPLCCIWWA